MTVIDKITLFCSDVNKTSTFVEILVHIGPRRVFSLFGHGHLGAIPQIRKFGPKFWQFDHDIWKTVSRSIICQLELNISTTAF